VRSPCGTPFITGALPGWINLVLGPVAGLALFATGVRLGGKRLDARGPELLAQLAVNR
jgi:ABC-2 type transport system permease protein